MPKVSKRLRYEVLRRDGFRGRYCGATPEERELRVDHVVPDSLGGRTEPSNLATACDPCNSGKSSVPPEAHTVDQVADDALRWSAAMQRAAADMEARLRERDDQNAVFLNAWSDCTDRYTGKPFVLDPAWSATVERVRTAGLTDRLIVEAVAATMGAHGVLPDNRFRYFCGVAWRMVAELQDSVGKLVSGNDEDGADAASESLTVYEYVAEQVLKAVPSWLREEAEREALDDYRKADEQVGSPSEILPHILRHAGYLLSECRIEPAGEVK